MKSSITTISIVAVSFGPNGVLPLMMRTPATRAFRNMAPTNERPLSAGGTKIFPSDAPALLKYSTEVLSAKSTSVNTAPNAFTVDGMLVAGMKNRTSVLVLPSGEKRRGELNVWNIVGYVGLISPNSGEG